MIGLLYTSFIINKIFFGLIIIFLLTLKLKYQKKFKSYIQNFIQKVKNLSFSTQVFDFYVKIPLIYKQNLPLSIQKSAQLGIQYFILEIITITNKEQRMGKTFDNRAFAKVQEYYLFNRLFSSVDPMQELDKQLNNSESILFEVIDQEKISQLKEYVLTKLQEGVKELQKRIRNGEQSQKLQEKMTKILTIQRRLHKNSQYRKQASSGFGPIYLGLLVWSSKMVLSEEILRIISQFSFDKSLKLYYYYFKYYMSHLNLYFPEQNKIKDLFIPNPTFNFGFFRHLENRDQSPSQRSGGKSQKFIISIQDIRKYFSDSNNGLIKGLNHFTGACILNTKYNLGLSQDNEIFHALMVKIKIFLSQDRNSVVRTVLYSDWIFGVFEIQQIQSGKKSVGLPQIFELPPDYSRILQQQIQLFFIPEATSETHLASLLYIDAMLTLQQKKGERQFNLSLNQNTQGLIRILESLISSLSKNQSQMINQDHKQIDKKIPLQSVKNKQLIQKVFYIIKRQISQATEIHNLAEQLATLIFTKKHLYQVSQKTIQHCGSILIAVEADEQEILNYSIERIKQNKIDSHSYLKVINSFFQTKQRRQRRDFGSIARSIAESTLFEILKPIILKQVNQSTVYNVKSYTNTVMELIANICGQNPTLIDIVSKFQIMDIILEFISRMEKINSYECITNSINFVHHICLKEGQVRNKVLTKYLQPFIRKLTCSNMSEYVYCKNFTFITNILTKFIGNIKNSYFYMYLGFTSAIKDMTNLSKNLPNFQFMIQTLTTITQQHFLYSQKQVIFDSKLIILLKLIQKTKEQFLPKLRPSWLNIMKRRLLKILFVRSNTLLDFPAQARLVIMIVHDIITAIDKRKKRTQQQNLTLNLERIQNNENNLDQGLQQRQVQEVVQGQGQVEQQVLDKALNQGQVQLQEIQDNLQILRQKQKQDDQKLRQLSLRSSSFRSEMQQMGFQQQNLQKSKQKQRQSQKQRQIGNEIIPQDKQKKILRSFSLVGQSNQPTLKYQQVVKAINDNNPTSKTVYQQKQQQKIQKQLNFLRYQIKSITKKLKQIFTSENYRLIRSPRKIYEIVTAQYAKNHDKMQEQISSNVLIQLKITLYISKLDRLLYYLTKQLNENYTNEYDYHDITLAVHDLLPHFMDIITIINVQFLQKNLTILKRLTQRQLLTQRQMVNYISSKRLIHELNLKQKQKIMYYHEFVQNTMKSLTPLVLKHDEKYIIQHLEFVVKPFIYYSFKILNRIKSQQIQQMRQLLSTTQCFQLKNIQKNILQLFCLYKVKDLKMVIYKPYNRILMYYLLIYSNTQQYKSGVNIFNLFLQMIKLAEKHASKQQQQYTNKTNLHKNLNIPNQKQTDVDKLFPLVDNNQNRSLMIRRIILKCLRQSIKQFIQNAFVLKLQSKIQHEAERLITQQMNQPSNQQNVIDLEILSNENCINAQKQRKEKQFYDKYVEDVQKYVEIYNKEPNFSQNPQNFLQIVSQLKANSTKAFLFTINTLYRQYTNLRINLYFNKKKNFLNMNNIRRSIPKIYKFVDTIKQYIKDAIHLKAQYEPQIFFSPTLLNHNNMMSIKQFNDGMESNFKTVHGWIIDNMHQEITKQDFVIMSIADDYIDIKQSQDIGDKAQRIKLFSQKYHEQLCGQILLISKRLFDNFILSWKMPRKTNKRIFSNVLFKIQEQKKTNKPINIRQQVLRLANICQIFVKQTQTFIELSFYSEGDPRYNNAFVADLVKFIAQVIGNYQIAEGEDKYKQEADLLTRKIIQFLKIYFEYVYNIQQQKKKLKKQKRRRLKNIKKSKNQVKKSKAQRKRLRKNKNNQQSLNMGSQLSKQIILSPQKNLQDQRLLRREQSFPNLSTPIERLQTPRNHPQSNQNSFRKKHTTSKKQSSKNSSKSQKNNIKKKSKSKQNLGKSIQALLCNILAASQTIPFLKNQTLHIVTDFIMTFMSESFGYKYIGLDINQLLPFMLRVRICENKHEGYFHKLSRIGIMLLSSVQSHVNREIGIKRLFFQMNTREIPMKQFVKRMGKFHQISTHFNSFSYFLQIKKQKKAQKDKQDSGRKPQTIRIQIKQNINQVQQSPIKDKIQKKDKDKQKEKNSQYQVLEFNRQNYKNCKKYQKCFVVLLPNNELNTINYNLYHKGYLENHLQTSYNIQQQYLKDKQKEKQKQKQKQKERQKQKQYQPIKTVQYIPNKKLQMFITQIIKRIIRLIGRNMQQANPSPQSPSQQSQNQSNIKTDIFKIITLVSTLQFLIRECPCLIPYVTKYKCWKLITHNMEGMSQKPKAMLSKLLNLQNKKQITFLAFLIRAISVLTFNTNFQILFTMCLDNTVIQKQKIITQLNQQNKTITQELPVSFVTFGHVVRQKALNQIQEILFSKQESYIRKFCIINLLTKLLTIRQMCRLCIQSHGFVKNLSKNYVDMVAIIKQNSLPQMSVISKKLLIPFYLNPVSILMQVNISLHLNKKEKDRRPKISMKLTNESIQKQLILHSQFYQTKFKQDWPYTTANQMNFGLDDEDLDNYESSSSSGDDDDLGGEDSSESELVQGQFQDFLQHANLNNDLDNDQDSNQDQQMNNPQNSVHYDQFTNSWINHDTILDDFIEDQQEVDEQQDNQQGNDPQRSSVMINIYPQQDDHVRQEDQDDDQDLLDLDDQDISPQDEEQGLDQVEDYSDLSSQQDAGEIQLSIVSNPIQNNGRIELLRVQSSQESNEEQVHNIFFDYEHFIQVPKVFYSYVNKNMQVRRVDHRNFIVKTQRLQDQLLQLLQALQCKYFKVKSKCNINKTKSKKQQQQQNNQQLYKKFRKIDIQQPFQIEDHQKCLIYFLDNHELINYSIHTEYNNYGKHKQYEWDAPPPERYSGEDKIQENGYANQDIIQDNIDLNMIMNRMGRINSRNRRNAVVIGDNMHIDRNFMEDFRQRNSSSRMNTLTFTQIHINNQDHNQIQQQPQPSEEEEEEDIPQEGVPGPNLDLNDQNNLGDNFQNFGAVENQFFMGMTTQQISAALQSQGFSYQDYMRFPSDIRADILQNIQQQNMVNQEFINRRDTHNQMRNIQINPITGQYNHLAQPNTPVFPHHNVQNSPSVGNFHNSQNQLLPHQQQSSRALGQGQNTQQQHSDHYKKLANHHIKKINKDIIHLINKQNKNCTKYFQTSQQFIESLLQLVYIVSDNDFIYFPFNLLACLCISPHNQTRILSNLITILIQGPYYLEVSNMMPYTKYTNNQNQFIVNYLRYGYINISLKILYLLLNLSKSYSISISMLYNQGKPTSRMNKQGVQEMLSQNTLLQNLISLLKFQVIKQSAINLQYLLTIIKNVTVIKFNYHIHSLVTGKDKNKDQKQKQNANKSQKMQNEKQFKQIELEKQKQKVDRSKDASLRLTEQNTSLLFSMLQGDFLRQNAQHLSKIIMRLSLDEKNLSSFIHFFKKVIRSLAQKITKSLVETYQKTSKSQSLPHRLSYKDKLYKSHQQPLIVRLMLIFYEIIKSMKRSITLQQKYINLLQQFRTILECQQIKQLCQKGCQIIEKNPSSPQIMPRIHEFIDCFFAIFNILQDNQQPQKLAQKEQKLSKVLSDNALLGKKISMKRKFTSNIINLQQLFEKKLCTPQGRAFINANIRNKLNCALKGRRFKQSLLGSPIILVALETPHMLQFDNKKSLFKVEIRRLKHKRPYGTVNLVIDRKDVFQQSFDEFMNMKADDLKGKLKIQFEGEQGEDVGGLTRQWFQLLSREMFNPNYALFIPSSTGSTYQPYSKSYVNGDHLKYFKFIGRIMGKALHDGYMLDAYFTPAFYKHILGLPISWKDMQQQDFEYYKSLKWILQNSPIEEFMELNFTYEFDNFGQLKNQNLVPNGDQIQVTQQNKIQYVHLISQAKMAQSVKKQYENLLQGFHEFIPPKIIKIFDQKQLQIMISGLPTIDIEDLRNNTDLVSYNKTDQVIIWLFEVLQEFDMGLRTAFLQFVTGTSRVPPEGFKALQGYNGHQKFNIHKYYDIKHLPRSHTCFNQLDLPPYQSKQILRQKLTLAITEGKEGFGIL